MSASTSRGLEARVLGKLAQPGEHHAVEQPKPKRNPAPLNESDLQRLADDHRTGLKINELAAKYGIHPWTVMRHLHRLQVERRQAAMSPAHVDGAAGLYRRGWSLLKVGEKFDVDPGTVEALPRRGRS